MNPGFVLVGAGSTVSTPGLLRDVTASGAFDDHTVHLVDLDARAAETMAAIGRRLARRRGSTVRFEAHTDRRAALPGARFVTTAIAVGRARGWRADLDVPARHGIRQTVGDSVGPGGVLRHVPEPVAIAEDVADLAGRAWLVNYCNPLTADGASGPPARSRTIASSSGYRSVSACRMSSSQHRRFRPANTACTSSGRRPSAVHSAAFVVGADRITGLAVGPLPQASAAVLGARVDQQELTVHAAMTGKRDTAIQALTIDPLVGDARTATAVLDDAVLAHAPHPDRFAAQ